VFDILVVDFNFGIDIRYRLRKYLVPPLIPIREIMFYAMPEFNNPLAEMHEYDHTNHSAQNGIQICLEPAEIIFLVEIRKRRTHREFYTADQYQG